MPSKTGPSPRANATRRFSAMPARCGLRACPKARSGSGCARRTPSDARSRSRTPRSSASSTVRCATSLEPRETPTIRRRKRRSPRTCAPTRSSLLALGRTCSTLATTRRTPFPGRRTIRCGAGTMPTRRTCTRTSRSDSAPTAERT